MTLKHLGYGLVVALSVSSTECIAMKKTSQPQEDVSESLEGTISEIKRRLKEVKKRYSSEFKLNNELHIKNYRASDRLVSGNPKTFTMLTPNRTPSIIRSDYKLALLLCERKNLEARLKEMSEEDQSPTEEDCGEKES